MAGRELSGSLHAERKRTGKDKCRCTPEQEENLAEPLLSHAPASTCGSCFTCPCLYRRWRDPEGTQREWRVLHPKASLGGGTARRWKGAGTRIQKRRLKRDRLKRKRRGREKEAKGAGRRTGAKGKPPRDYWKRENRSSPLGQPQRLADTLDVVL